MANTRFRLRRLAASSPDGGIHDTVPEGRATVRTFRRFLEKLVREIPTQVLLIADRCSLHTAAEIREWVAEHGAEIKLHHQLTYLPEVNPVELLWALVKRRVSRLVSKTKAQLLVNLEAALQSLQESPERVPSFLREADCKYILA